MPRFKIQPFEHPPIAGDYLSGTTAQELADRYGVCKKTIYRICAKEGVQKNPPKLGPVEREIILLYKQGENTSQIAKEYDVDQSTVWAFLRTRKMLRNRSEAYLRTYSQKERPIKYNVNHSFFSSWSESMAWVLGVLVADGCVISRSNNIILSLVEKDQDVLRKIKNLIQFTGPIKRIQECSPNSNQHQYLLAFNSRQMKADLIRLGITPRKTHTLKMSYIPEKFLWHFIRGFFDGDGCVYKSANQIKICFTIASRLFAEQLTTWLSQNGIVFYVSDRKYYQISLSTPNSMKFYSLIYPDGVNTSTMHMDRKYDHFTKLIKEYVQNLPTQCIPLRKIQIDSVIKNLSESLTIDWNPNVQDYRGITVMGLERQLKQFYDEHSRTPTAQECQNTDYLSCYSTYHNHLGRGWPKRYRERFAEQPTLEVDL